MGWFSGLVDKVKDGVSTLSNKVRDGAQYVANKIPVIRTGIDFARKGLSTARTIADSPIGSSILSWIPGGNMVKNGLDAADNVVNKGEKVTNFVNSVANAITNTNSLQSGLDNAKTVFDNGKSLYSDLTNKGQLESK